MANRIVTAWVSTRWLRRFIQWRRGYTEFVYISTNNLAGRNSVKEPAGTKLTSPTVVSLVNKDCLFYTFRDGRQFEL